MIKNYTSDTPAALSVSNIEKVLVDLGATNIVKQYENGALKAISFSLKRGESMIPFKLPARVEAIKKAFLKKLRKTPTQIQLESYQKQAERTAWKNMHEWVQIQATMIYLDQIEFMEAFMPYVYSLERGQTYYETMKANGFKQLN